MAAAQPQGKPSPDTVLTKALLRASEDLGLSQKELARVIGVSESTLSRIAAARRIPDVRPVASVVVARKEGELALLLLRVYRSLDALVGGDPRKLRAWFDSPNTHLGGVPRQRVQSAEGLVMVATYLDGMRGTL